MPSPTFTLMVPYEAGGKKLYHFDLYRFLRKCTFCQAKTKLRRRIFTFFMFIENLV